MSRIIGWVPEVKEEKVQPKAEGKTPSAKATSEKKEPRKSEK